MTRLYLALFWLFGTAWNAQTQTLVVGTFNIRYDNRGDSGNRWEQRRNPMADLIRFHDFDVLGTQEGLANQLADLEQALPTYARSGVGRDDGKAAGEHAAIFYKKALFQREQAGDFWLSETPEQPSKGWDARCCNRLCSWVKLRHKASGQVFFFFNAHYDHEGVAARRESSRLILSRIQTLARDLPVILVGDLNGEQGSECYQILTHSGFIADTHGLAAAPYANNGTFNGFGATVTRKAIIDHVFVSRHFAADRWGVLTDTYGGKYISDHFPVLVLVTLR